MIIAPNPAAMASAMIANRNARHLVQVVTDFEAKYLPPPEKVGIEIKQDGFRAVGRHTLMRTREGMPIACLATEPFTEALHRLEMALGGRIILDGEYVNLEGFDEAMVDFRTGEPRGHLVLWDQVPEDVYYGAAPSKILRRRYDELEEALDKIHISHRGILHLSRQWRGPGHDQDGIEDIAGVVWEGGDEGIVVKDLDSPHQRGPSRDWMRIKRRETLDLRIIAQHVEGGRLTKVVVDYQGKDVVVWAGFSEHQRHQPELFRPGTIIEIRHLGRTSKGSLKSPSFLRIRPDKEI